MWIVRLAMRRLYTFLVAVLVLLLITPSASHEIHPHKDTLPS